MRCLSNWATQEPRGVWNIFKSHINVSLVFILLCLLSLPWIFFFVLDIVLTFYFFFNSLKFSLCNFRKRFGNAGLLRWSRFVNDFSKELSISVFVGKLLTVFFRYPLHLYFLSSDILYTFVSKWGILKFIPLWIFHISILPIFPYVFQHQVDLVHRHLWLLYLHGGLFS